MTEVSAAATPLCRYFVDESSDGVLFDSKGRVLLESGDAPQHFLLGMVELAEERAVGASLTQLRAGLLADPYFKDVPSFQPEAGKTARQFHAKDDLPEVRREVFKTLLGHDFKFYAVVKSMHAVLAYVRSRNGMDAAYRYQPNELYDLTVRMLFKERLHQHTRYEVVFARRGKSDRTRAMQAQLGTARQRFLESAGRDAQPEIQVLPASPHERPGLQVADYCLWALQRLFERREDRFLQLLWPKVSLIHDVDDKSLAPYGRYYNRKHPPLTGADMEKRRV